MTTARRFEELECWKLARELVNGVYSFTKSGEALRDFGFRNQICRAAVSVISNIAEGFESRTQVQFIEYLGHAKASLGEVRAQLYVALDQNYLSREEFSRLRDLAELNSRQVHNLITYLEKQPNKHRISEDGSTYLA